MGTRLAAVSLRTRGLDDDAHLMLAQEGDPPCRHNSGLVQEAHVDTASGSLCCGDSVCTRSTGTIQCRAM
jgi:hypothetical protein